MSILSKHIILPATAMLLAAGCTTGLGPQAIQSERPDYNRVLMGLGADTTVGAAFLGVGAADAGNDCLYFSLGNAF